MTAGSRSEDPSIGKKVVKGCLATWLLLTAIGVVLQRRERSPGDLQVAKPTPVRRSRTSKPPKKDPKVERLINKGPVLPCDRCKGSGRMLNGGRTRYLDCPTCRGIGLLSELDHIEWLFVSGQIGQDEYMQRSVDAERRQAAEAEARRALEEPASSNADNGRPAGPPIVSQQSSRHETSLVSREPKELPLFKKLNVEVIGEPKVLDDARKSFDEDLLFELAFDNLTRGHLKHARFYFERARNPRLRGFSAIWISVIDQNPGHLSKVRRPHFSSWDCALSAAVLGRLEEPELLKRARNDPSKRCEALCYLGLAADLQGRTEEAMMFYRRSSSEKSKVPLFEQIWVKLRLGE